MSGINSLMLFVRQKFADVANKFPGTVHLMSLFSIAREVRMMGSHTTDSLGATMPTHLPQYSSTGSIIPMESHDN